MPGRIIKISFTIPDGTSIECHGRIIWLNRVSSSLPHGFVVNFAMLPKDAKAALANYVEAS
jgi:hypothetical protein